MMKQIKNKKIIINKNRNNQQARKEYNNEKKIKAHEMASIIRLRQKKLNRRDVKNE